MTILLASGTPHLPQVVGGLEINTHELAVELNNRGHRAAVLAKLSLRDAFGRRQFAASCFRLSQVSSDAQLGYSVLRSRKPWRDLRGLPPPDLVVVQNGNMVGIGDYFRRLGIPVVAYLHGLEFESRRLGWDRLASDLPFKAYIANSSYTGERFKARFDVEPEIIPPIFRPERYRVDREAQYVTFINPVKEKGVDIAIEIAALCPDIPFRFVRSWPIASNALNALRENLRQLPNVVLEDAYADMRQVYRRTKILLVPSIWTETWGRVASEAQFSGIPVLGSSVGGLPEAIGPGGTLIEPNSHPIVWAVELRRLFHDADYYKLKSEAALAHSRRPAIDIECQVNRILQVIEGAVS